MDFETGGSLEDPFDEDNGKDGEIEEDVRSDTDEEIRDEPTRSDGTKEKQQPDNSNNGEAHEGASLDPELADAADPDHTQTVEQNLEIPYVKDIDITESVSTTVLSRALMVPDYHEDNPPVPYSVWREGTSTGRNRTTIELNSDVDALVRQALQEFNSRYETDICKADVRELALAYGLIHLDEVFEMAEEWGIQYNS